MVYNNWFESIRREYSHCKLDSQVSSIISEYWNEKCTSIIYEEFKEKGLNCRFTILPKLNNLFGSKKNFEMAERLGGINRTNPKTNRRGFLYQDEILKYSFILIFKRKLYQEFGKKVCAQCKKDFYPKNIYSKWNEILKDSPFCMDCLNYASHAPINYEYWFSNRHLEKINEDNLKKIYEIIGVIPPFNFKNNLEFLENINKDCIQEVIKLLIRTPDGQYYKNKYNSWFEALIRMGILPEDIRRLSRGTMVKAKDGHFCLSMAEKMVDDWLYKHNIKHDKEPRYPKDYNLNPRGLLRADWFAKGYYIEFFGLKGNKDYDSRIFLKKEIVNKFDLKLIEIYHKDLQKLDKILFF